MKKYAIAGLLVMAVILTGCSKKQVDAGNAPIIHKLEFAPSPAADGKDLHIKVEYDIQEKEGRVLFSYKWYRDNELLKDYTGDTLPGMEVRQGSVIYAEVMAKNKMKESPWLATPKIKVGVPGVIFNRIWIEPASPKKSDVLQVNYECENCQGLRLYYRWMVNGQELKDEDEPELSGPDAGLKPGDEVVGEISPEPDNPDNFHSSSPVKIIARNPVFADNGRLWVSNNTVYFQFRAQDPDGGAITYELMQSPDGASLDAGAGMATWPVPQGFSGAAEFKVKAKNSAGMETYLSGGFDIQDQQPPPQ